MYLESIKEDLKHISAADKKTIQQAIEKKITTHPIEFGKPLRYSLKGARRLRVGDYRVIYVIENTQTVVITKIGHRKDIYD